MVDSTYNMPAPAEPRTLATGYVFGAPVKDLGWLASIIMGLASGMIAFFALTFLGIVGIVLWNANGHHADITASYRVIGLPAGLLVGAVALAYLGRLRIKRALRRA